MVVAYFFLIRYLARNHVMGLVDDSPAVKSGTEHRA